VNLFDRIVSFLLAIMLHLLGLLMAIGLDVRIVVPEVDPALAATSVELTLTDAADDDGAAGGAAPQAAGRAGSPQAPVAPAAQTETPPPLELPRPVETLPEPSVPESPAPVDLPTPPPEPVVVPVPVPEPVVAPVPVPEPVPVQVPEPVATLTPAPAPPQEAAPQPVPAAPPAVSGPADAEQTGELGSSPSSDDTSGQGLATLQPVGTGSGTGAGGTGAGGGTNGRVDTHPSLERAIKPNYPIGSRRRGEEGTVIIDVTVAVDGRAAKTALVSSCGFPELDSAAERAAGHARFKPGTRDGKPVESAARLTLIFRLRDS
jgi:TonB family protein